MSPHKTRKVASTFLLALLPVLTACPLDQDGPTDPEREANVYRVTLTGDVGFLSGSGYVPFTQTGHVYLVPTLDPDALSGNGKNPVDVAIVTDASPIAGNAGGLYFGTNTSTCRVVHCTRIGDSLVDVAFVTRNGNTIDIQIDGNVFALPNARLDIFNIYNLQTSILTQVQNVYLGKAELTLEGSRIRGTVLLNGNSGFGHPTPTTYYRATITGEAEQP
jgi:hypothetical protein